MKYMGSKASIAKYILPFIHELLFINNIDTYIEPFIGGANMIDKVRCNNKKGSDINKYLIALFNHVKNGGELPTEVSYELYQDVKYSQDTGKYEDWFTGAVCFLAGFNGRGFDGGYGKATYETKADGTKILRDYFQEARRNLIEQTPLLKDIEITQGSYEQYSGVKDTLIYCLPKGSLIWQNGVYKPIEEVVENETNLGNGNICIKKHVRNATNEKIINIGVLGLSKHFDLQLSEDHKVFIYDENKGIIIKQAKDIVKGDKLIIEADSEIDEYIPEIDYRCISSKAVIPVIDKTKRLELAKLLGLFMAEGHIQNGVILSFNSTENELHDEALRLFKEVFDVEAVKYFKNKSVTQIHAYSTELGYYFQKLYNEENAPTKALKEFVMKWDTDMQLQLLIGWLQGDGGIWHDKDSNRIKISGTSASFKLAYQMYNIALRCGLKPSFKKRVTKRKQLLKDGRCESVCYDVYFTSLDDANKLFGILTDGKNRSKRAYIDNKLITVVKDIYHTEYTGEMYDLTTTKGYILTFGNIKIHNCDPPYANTKSYNRKINFDHNKFWQWVRDMSKDNIVLVSEESAPDDFDIIWEQEVTRSIRANEKSKTTEKLFIWREANKYYPALNRKDDTDNTEELDF